MRLWMDRKFILSRKFLFLIMEISIISEQLPIVNFDRLSMEKLLEWKQIFSKTPITDQSQARNLAYFFAYNLSLPGTEGFMGEPG